MNIRLIVASACALVFLLSAAAMAAGRRCYTARFDLSPVMLGSKVVVCFRMLSSPSDEAAIYAAYETGGWKLVNKTLRRMRVGYIDTKRGPFEAPFSLRLRWIGCRRIGGTDAKVGLGIDPGVYWPHDTKGRYRYFLVWIGHGGRRGLSGGFAPLARFDFDRSGRLQVHASRAWALRLSVVKEEKR